MLSGKLQLQVAGAPVTLVPGNILRLPADVPHSAEALEDTVVLDVFTPPRSDWQ